MSLKNLCSMISPVCYKRQFTKEEYERIKGVAVRARATDLYGIYRCLTDTPMPYKEFYRELKELFYYDKYVCEHGTEFMYLVVFTKYKYVEMIPSDIKYIITAI